MQGWWEAFQPPAPRHRNIPGGRGFFFEIQP